MSHRLKCQSKNTNSEENISINVCDFGFDNSFSDVTPKVETRNEKLEELDSIKVKTVFYFKFPYVESEKTMHRMEETTCKSWIWLGTGIQNMYRTLIAQQ